MRPETLAGLSLETCQDDRFDFSDEEPTSPDKTTMSNLMDSMANEDHEICLSSSERPTKPIRPMVRSKEENGG